MARIGLHDLKEKVLDLPGDTLIGISAVITGTTGVLYLSGGVITTEQPLPVIHGGTGAATFAANSLLVGNGTGAILASGTIYDLSPTDPDYGAEIDVYGTLRTAFNPPTGVQTGVRDAAASNLLTVGGTTLGTGAAVTGIVGTGGIGDTIAVAVALWGKAATASIGTIAKAIGLVGSKQTVGTTSNIDLFLGSTSSTLADAPSGDWAIYSLSTRESLLTAKLTLPSVKITTGASSGYFLTSDASGNASWASIGGTISGLTTGTIPKAASATSLTDSLLSEGSGFVQANANLLSNGAGTHDLGSSTGGGWRSLYFHETTNDGIGRLIPTVLPVGTLTWTLPAITGTVAMTSVAGSGTGRATATAYAVICGGTTSTGAQQSIASVGTSGQVLTSNGAGALPTFQAATGGITSLNSLTGATQTFTNDTNVTIVSGGTAHVITWAGTLAVARGGTAASSAGITAFNNITGYSAAGATGTTSTNLVFSTSPTLVTPVLGTPSSGTLSSCTGYAQSALTGLGTGVSTFLGTPSSANLLAAVTDETGSSLLVFNTSPVIVTPTISAQSSAAGTTYSNTATISVQTASAIAGTAMTFTASDAIAGSSNVGAAAGGAITLTTGAAKRLTSGNANGGTYAIVTGAGIGTGSAGYATWKFGAGGTWTFGTGTSDDSVILTNSSVPTTSSLQSVVIGGLAAGNTASSTGTNNVIIGLEACDTLTSGSGNVYIGRTVAINANTEGGGLTGVGMTAGGTNVFIGQSATATVNTIGSSIALGYQARVTASNMAVFGGSAMTLFQLSSDNSSAVTKTLRGAGARAAQDTDTAGSSIAVGGGLATGSGVSGSVLLQAATAGSTGTAAQTLATIVEIAPAGNIKVLRTITAAGTTGNQTINKPNGTVNIAAAGTTVTVTNSLCDVNSIVLATIATNDATARIASVVPGSGSFVINIVACTAEVSVRWSLRN